MTFSILDFGLGEEYLSRIFQMHFGCFDPTIGT